MTASEVARLLAEKALLVAQMLLPEGKRDNHIWQLSHSDCHYKIMVEGDQKGQWVASNKEQAGDLIDLWSHIRNISLAEAIFAAKQWLGVGGFRFIATAPKNKLNLEVSITNRLKESSFLHHHLLNTLKLKPITLHQFQLSEIKDCLAIPYVKQEKIKQIKYIDFYDYENHMPHSFEVSQQTTLFGWQAMPDNVRMMVLTLSEMDAMSLHQYGVPALAIPYINQKKTSLDWLAEEYDNLSVFDKIYFAWSIDANNAVLTDTLRERLGRYRCYQLELPHKTPNLCLQNAISTETIKQCIENARTLDPDELKSATDFTESVIELVTQESQQLHAYSLPWLKCRDRLVLRPNELSVWTGINGHGKSQLLGFLMLHCIQQGAKVCIASLELMPERLLLRLSRQLHASDVNNETLIRSAQDWYANRLWLFDLVGSAKTERLFSVFEYARQRYGIDVFLIDSLMKCGIAEDDYNAQKQFVEQLCDFKNSHPCHIHLVAHPRKSQNENHLPNKMDIKGSGAITDLADNVFSVWRNKDQASGEPNAVLQCDKQRNGEWEGKVSLWFDLTSFHYLESEKSKPLSLICPDEAT